MAHFFLCKSIGLLACMAAGTAALAAPAGGSGRGRIFVSPYACTQGGLRADQCANAFANAQAELDDAAPRFPTRTACEQHFRRCSIDVASGKRLTFRPSLQGVSVTLSTGRPSVVPVVAATGPALAFQPRPVDEKRTERSPQRRRQAQARWDQQLAAPAQLPEAVDPSFVPERADDYDPNWQKQEGVATYPGPRARARQAPNP